MSWTKEKTARLCELDALKWSFGDIGKDIGMSRNACIGKARRLGLPARGTSQPRPRESKPGARIRTPNRIRYIQSLRANPRPLAIVKPPEQISKNPLTLAELTKSNCRFPISGEGANTLYCGDKIHSRSYCWHHFHLCYEPARRMTEARKPTTPSTEPVPPLAPEEMVA